MNATKAVTLLSMFTCTTIALSAGCSSNAPNPGSSTASANGPSQSMSPEVRAWRQSMSRVRAPHAGCFEAVHPSTTLVEIPCAAPQDHPVPMVPRQQGTRGAGPGMIVGDGADFSAQSTGTISWATGEFTNVNVASLTDSNYGSNYSIQFNTNTFAGASLCSGALDPSKCRGWQQFSYQTPNLLIEYWLINYNNACPTGWTGYQNGPTQYDCWMNNPAQQYIGYVEPSQLGAVSMNVTADTQDQVTMFYISTVPGPQQGLPTYRVLQVQSVLNLAAGWTGAEFNVFGYGNLSQANFNDGATMDVIVETENIPVSPHAPACSSEGFTGETNNLYLETPCCAIDLPPGTSPQIRFTEASHPLQQPTQLCPAFLDVNDSPLVVTQGGTSEANVLMYGSWITQDHGNGALSSIVANNDPQLTIVPSLGTDTIDGSGAVNLMVSAPLGATVGKYNASVQVTDVASNTTFTTTVPIDVVACTPPSNSICTTDMCGIWNANDCGGVNCGVCSGTNVCSSGHCCPANSTFNGTVCQPSMCPTGTSWCSAQEACLTDAQCNPTCPPTKPLCAATNTCMTVLACNKLGGGGGTGGGCKGTTCM